MVESAYQRAKNILLENRDKLEKLAQRLLDKEVIFREDLEEIFGKRPYDVEETDNIKEEIKINTDKPANIVASVGENSGTVASIPKEENPKT
jgi:cell division protease FtsH